MSISQGCILLVIAIDHKYFITLDPLLLSHSTFKKSCYHIVFLLLGVSISQYSTLQYVRKLSMDLEVNHISVTLLSDLR